jgi:hypothetical protein
MKLKLLAIFFLLITAACGGDEEDYYPGISCTHNGKTLHLGPKGGCYYINSNGNKTYVDRSECRC